MVTLVALCVQVYSIAYQSKDPRYRAFAATVSLFTAAMLLVVQADNLVLLLIGWEVMGLCSYLLVGHESERQAARAAAVKAFLVTRVGDIGFVLGIIVLWVASGTTSASACCCARATLASLGIDDADRRDGAAAGRGDRQVRAVPAAHLAAGRDGGPDAGLGADPRGHHGRRRWGGAGPAAADAARRTGRPRPRWRWSPR